MKNSKAGHTKQQKAQEKVRAWYRAIICMIKERVQTQLKFRKGIYSNWGLLKPMETWSR